MNKRSEEHVDRQYAVDQVRGMAYQYADLYFAFVSMLRDTYGEETALELTQKVLYQRAFERASDMRERAAKLNIECTPETILKTSDVSYLGWVTELGVDHCPYGTAWNKRISKNPWFRPFAALYCDVTDTTVAEVYTEGYSHKLHENVVLGHESCERTYYPDEEVRRGKRTYAPQSSKV